MKRRRPTVRIVDEDIDLEDIPIEQPNEQPIEQSNWQNVSRENPPSPPAKANNDEEEELQVPRKTIYRDTSGRIIDIETERKRIADNEQRKLEEAEEQRIRNLGTKQKQAILQRAKEEEGMRDKPFGRSRDDEEINKDLAARVYWEDPMPAASSSKKKSRKSRRQDSDECPHAATPNRFGIRPGRRWDGVDRSNGFEARWFQKHYTQKSRQTEAYKWSVEDM